MTNPQQIFSHLSKEFQGQDWWPGDTAFEVCVGAILTQNTNWKNVEQAIANLKVHDLLSVSAINSIDLTILENQIKPSGYFRQKAKRLKGFVETIVEIYGTFERLNALDDQKLREFLLSVSGIGPETADSMLLYAFGRSSFVVDSYTKRFLVRHTLVSEEANYYEVKDYFESHLESDTNLFKDFHAMIVQLGKSYCSKSKPSCQGCPLRDLNGGPVL